MKDNFLKDINSRCHRGPKALSGCEHCIRRAVVPRRRSPGPWRSRASYRAGSARQFPTLCQDQGTAQEACRCNSFDDK